MRESSSIRQSPARANGPRNKDGGEVLSHRFSPGWPAWRSCNRRNQTQNQGNFGLKKRNSERKAVVVRWVSSSGRAKTELDVQARNQLRRNQSSNYKICRRRRMREAAAPAFSKGHLFPFLHRVSFRPRTRGRLAGIVRAERNLPFCARDPREAHGCRATPNHCEMLRVYSRHRRSECSFHPRL